MTDYVQVSTTADSREAALALLRSAVAARLAASGQVFGPAVSVFWHKGEIGEGQEWQVVLKTTADRYSDLEDHLIAEHPWENPEVTAWTLNAGSAGYLEWLSRTTGG